jgi:hypothetical protein
MTCKRALQLLELGLKTKMLSIYDVRLATKCHSDFTFGHIIIIRTYKHIHTKHDHITPAAHAHARGVITVS